MSGHEWEDDDEWLDFTNEWLYDNDDCPPCDIYIDQENEQIKSGCGCHDDLDFNQDREIWEGIVFELTNED